MILAAPLLVLGLLVLPLLWWLLRALPPAPRVQSFPAIRLLHGLRTRAEQPRKAPPWLLALRIAAGVLLVLGLAQPVLVQDRGTLPGQGSLLLVIDNGWAAAPDWAARLQAARQSVDRAGRAGRPVRLLLTAGDLGGGAPLVGPTLRADSLRTRLDDLRLMPWPVDRAAAAAALRDGGRGGVGSVVYLSDGLATAADPAFVAALRAAGPVSELRASPPLLAVLDRPVPQPGRLLVRVEAMPAAAPRSLVLRGEAADGASLARIAVPLPAGAARAQAPIVLPAELRNQLSRLVLDGMPGAGGVRLLDEGDRRRPVGLLTETGGDTPLLGALFFLRRALAPTAELREGSPGVLLSRQVSVLIAPDGTLDDPAARARVLTWVRNGGMLIRFAGPRLAARTAGPEAGVPGDPDPLLPVRLLGGARQLGGAMSWGQPEHPAPFTDGPFAGLALPAEVTVSRQVLAEPSSDLSQHSWARLTDGTPLVTHATLGDGQLVLFHVTGTADWSNLPLSGLFPSMLQRLVQRAAGLAAPGDRTVLAPALTLGGDGQLGLPPAGATGLRADRFGVTPASALHPAGLYGPPASRRSLNLADALPPLAPQAASGQLRSLDDRLPDRPLGPPLLALALALLVVDVVATLFLRGLLRARPTGRVRQAAPLLLLLPVLWTACCVPAGPADAVVPGPVPGAAIETRLAYVVTGVAAVDDISREGLEGLTAYANARTSVQLGHPDGVVPGRDDLAFYPMLYWPVTPATAATTPDGAWTASLNAYMGHGGILLIDTQGSDNGSGGGGADFTLFAPGTREALHRATTGLDIPSLRPVDQAHVLSRSFYLLRSYPGRYVGAPVWVASEDDLGNDGVSPVIIGANDWAGAWAIDSAGQTPYAVIPGGEEQRVIAYRFGVNAVIYALTGNYKTDQVHVPALLQRLGQ